MNLDHGHISPAQFIAYDRGAWDQLTPIQKLAVAKSPRLWRRHDQLIPEGYRYATFLCGRSYGKTKTLALELQSEVNAGRATEIGMAAQDLQRCLDIQCAELLDTAVPWNRCHLFKEAMVWDNGAVAYLFSPEKPTKPRGSNLTHVWLTEVGHYPKVGGFELFQTITSACRVNPARVLIDTTTHGPSQVIDHIMALHAADPEKYPIIRGETYLNPMNPKDWLREMWLQYTGRALKEELEGLYFAELDGASWERAFIDDHRVDEVPPLECKIVGCDPAESTRADADDTGMVLVGRDKGKHLFLLDDRSGKHTPESYARALLDYHRRGATGAVIETNRCGAFVAGVLRAYAQLDGIRIDERKTDDPWPRHDPRTLYVKLIHTRGDKLSRHAGAAALAKQGLLHHVGTFSRLEERMVSYFGEGPSPDDLDALSLAVNDLGELHVDRPNRAGDVRAAAVATRDLHHRAFARARSQSVI